MTADTPLRRTGRAGALLLTGLALVATMDSGWNPPVEFDVTGSCGPAGRIVVDPGAKGCGSDPTSLVGGGALVGLPPFAIGLETSEADPEKQFTTGQFDPEVRIVLNGPVTLPGSEPPLTVHRTCRVEAEVAGVRAFACAGDLPEAACEGTMTPVPQAAATVSP